MVAFTGPRFRLLQVWLCSRWQAEEGCIGYDRHRSVEEPGLIMFHENWTTRPLWEQHMQAPHRTGFSAATEGIVEVWELFLGEKVGA